jgi:hypothetical protein
MLYGKMTRQNVHFLRYKSLDGDRWHLATVIRQITPQAQQLSPVNNTRQIFNARRGAIPHGRLALPKGHS